VGIGYGWMLRTTYGLMAVAAAFVGFRFRSVLVRDVASIGVAVACVVGLGVSWVRRRSGVLHQREQVQAHLDEIAPQVITAVQEQPRGTGDRHRWFRIERKGSLFTLFSSADGTAWKTIKAVELPKMSATAQAGFVIYSIPCATNKVHWARFDQISITP